MTDEGKPGRLAAAERVRPFHALSTIEPIASTIAGQGKPFFFVNGYGPCLLAELQSAIDTALS